MAVNLDTTRCRIEVEILKCRICRFLQTQNMFVCPSSLMLYNVGTCYRWCAGGVDSELRHCKEGSRRKQFTCAGAGAGAGAGAN
eukprot:gene2410-5352_t